MTGRWVEELRRVCTEALRGDLPQPRRLVLDLADVLFIDAQGIALFRELTGRRVSLTNCSLFVTEQLKEVANANG